jgi:hypothetical protein
MSMKSWGGGCLNQNLQHDPSQKPTTTTISVSETKRLGCVLIITRHNRRC